MRLNLARTLPRSATNGPGERFTVWVQGCPLRCAGCWNPDTWRFAPRLVRDAAPLLAEIRGTEGIEGVTFTGGEPFAQAEALAWVGQGARAAGLSVCVFTGYELTELTAKAHRALLAVSDVVVAGRYERARRVEGVAWRGSANQRVHFLTARYSERDLASPPEAECHLGPDGAVVVTGFPRRELLDALDASPPA